MATHGVRVRFAPSPTGSPHIGNIRTALFNWLYARHTGGVFVLRIEDTDQVRLAPGSVEVIADSLRWLGLDWDEGSEVGGPCGPYIQSERLDVYRQHVEVLVANGSAYRCYCSPERLAQVRQEQAARKEPVRYDRACRDLGPAERAAREAAGQSWVVRFRVPLTGRTVFQDVFRGEIGFDNANLDDHVLLKSDGWPTYQLAHIVDDHLMGISHVLRGDEWISSAPRHILTYQAFGWEPPSLGHFGLILGRDRTKLSKRHGATDVLSYRAAGYLPAALVNFLALLGWSPPPLPPLPNGGEGRAERSDILSRDELCRLFDLDRIGVTPAVFDAEKLDWMNGYYIRQLAPDALAAALVPFLQRAGLLSAELPPADRDYVRAIVPLIQERLKRLAEAPDLVDFFFQARLGYDPALLTPKGLERAAARSALATVRERLAGLPAFDEASLETALRTATSELGLKTGPLFGALRVAVTGRTVAPPLFQTLAVLGRGRVQARLDRALELLA